MKSGKSWPLGPWFAGGLLVLIGLTLSAGGVWLLLLGGSFYYAAAGLACMVAGILMIAGRASGLWLYVFFMLATIFWSIGEVGLDFWQLLPRLTGPGVVALLFALPVVWRRLSGSPWAGHASFGVGALTAALLLFAWANSGPQFPANNRASVISDNLAATGSQSWTNYGGDSGGQRFSKAGQIKPSNVADLVPAWTFRTGETNALRPDIKVSMSFMVTPLMADGRLFFCTPLGVVIALDPDSGAQLWRHDPKADPGAAQMLNCRGVSYHASNEQGPCAKRILSTTLDGRLLALDAVDGSLCKGFGDDGAVSLAAGLGRVEKGATYTTSPPAIIGDVAVLGAYVRDNFSTDEPSGVVRAFDVKTGDMLWAWDAGRPDGAGPLKRGETYSRGSPNAWSVFSADPYLKMVFIPTGNATPDHIGVHRTALQERYASSIVALDAETGQVRWHFQTTHHDLWDYDVPAQPVLFDFPAKGRTVAAVAGVTKRGEIFILDRQTGRPLTGIEDRPVPQGDIPNEHYAATQPYQTKFPSLAPKRLRESDMWGATPIDQLWCRITYRAFDYAGDFTPPSTRGAIQYPGIFGALNWGSVSVDPRRKLMIVNSSAIPQIVRLYPKSEQTGTPAAAQNAHVAGYLPQDGTPYGVTLLPMLSPLGLPCHAPPWGHLTAIDLQNRSVAWQRPLGTSRDIAPLGISVPGIFNIGGSVTTATGVTFIGATLDDYLRAFDTQSGRELWRQRLPAGGQATPMTYVSPRTGKQYVVIAAGGHGFLGSTPGDYLVAFALPEQGRRAAGAP